MEAPPVAGFRCEHVHVSTVHRPLALQCCPGAQWNLCSHSLNSLFTTTVNGAKHSEEEVRHCRQTCNQLDRQCGAGCCQCVGNQASRRAENRVALGPYTWTVTVCIMYDQIWSPRDFHTSCAKNLRQCNKLVGPIPCLLHTEGTRDCLPAWLPLESEV